MRELIIALGMAVTATAWSQQQLAVTVRADRPGHAIPRTLYGIFFEDINYAADGGLYPELIANRGFDWRTREPEGWAREWRGGRAWYSASASSSNERRSPPSDSQCARTASSWPAR